MKGRQYKILLTLLVTSFFALTADLIDRSGSHLLSAFFALRYPSASDLSSDIVTAGDKDVPWEAIQYWGPTYTVRTGFLINPLTHIIALHYSYVLGIVSYCGGLGLS